MTAISEFRGIARDLVIPFDDDRCSLCDCFSQLTSAIVAVYALTDAIRSVKVRLRCRSHLTSFDDLLDRRSVHHHHEFARIKPQLRVQAQRAAMKCCLQQANPWKIPL